jgi:hypothetical protein
LFLRVPDATVLKNPEINVSNILTKYYNDWLASEYYAKYLVALENEIGIID